MYVTFADGNMMKRKVDVYKRQVQELFFPVAEQIWLDVIFSCKGIEIFLTLKQLNYKI